jgi:hypothetical protein
MVAQRNPKIDMNPSKYVDESTLDELEKDGFFKRFFRELSGRELKGSQQVEQAILKKRG